MSTKVYQGIRFPKNRLGEFVDYVRPAQLRRVEEHAREMASKVSTKSEAYEDRAKKHRAWKKAVIRHKKDCWHCKCGVVMASFREQVENANRNPWLDLGCGFNLWVPSGRFVLGSPWGNSITDVTYPEWVEEYAYWNNTDPLETVSTREWDRREKAWEGVLEHQDRKLSLTSFDCSAAHTVDMSWLSLRLVRGDSWGDPNGR